MPSPGRRLRIAIIKGDPVDVAIDWQDCNFKETDSELKSSILSIPVVNMANEERPGGDWKSKTIAPEERLCRRSTLVEALATIDYPLQATSGVYSPSIVVFRANAVEDSAVWEEHKSLPIISVAPIGRPKLDESGTKYSFELEKELMKRKMRAILRIAVERRHPDLCMGPFGVGYRFQNPAGQVAEMWRELLFCEEEFCGHFSNVVFAIEDNIKASDTVIEIFRREFDPSNIFKTSYRRYYATRRSSAISKAMTTSFYGPDELEDLHKRYPD